jgi:hypothetical protein
MGKSGRYSLQIQDIFKFKDGRTVIVGTVQGDPSYIPPGEVELKADGDLIAVFRIEGEMISFGPAESWAPRLRAVSTDSTRCLDREFLARKRLVLEPLDSVSLAGR